MRRDDAAAATVITGVASAASDGADRALNLASAVIDVHQSGDVRSINTMYIAFLVVPAVALVLLLLAGVSGMSAFVGSCLSCALSALVVLATSDDSGTSGDDSGAAE